jgi:ABC-type antimicrobial peptide transport system permease subunit
VISHAFWQRRFGGSADVLGRGLTLNGAHFTIVGVARDAKYYRLTETAMPYFYVPINQFYGPSMGLGLEVRTADRPETFAKRLRTEIRSVDPNVAISGTAPFTAYMSASYFAQKVGASLLTVLGLISFALAMLGLYGVMTYSMSQRTQEIGIRMAIGARPGQVLGLVIGEGMRLCLIGAATGVALALVVMRLASSVLYGVASDDLMTCLGASSLLSACALLMAWLPARRASRIDPIQALRWE